ncbi:MAG: glycosyl hydrolase family 18 protein, partial [Actinomycetota bacterium]
VTPYVDVTLPPIHHFEDPLVNSAAEVALGFIVADPNDGCRPTWGTFYDLDAAGRALDLDRRVERYRERGGDVIVSFGGQANDELAVVCTDHDDLVASYESVIDRYDLSVIDLDIEGPALSDRAGNERRARAIAEIQEDRDLEVWLTVPVAPSGMTGEGTDLVDTMLDAGVELEGVNVMTMNFGESRQESTMIEATLASVEATREQVARAFLRADATHDDPTFWAAVGATPMIGHNDVAGDEITTDDASILVHELASLRLGRLSFWSLNRDQACGAGAADGASPRCSGTEQETGQFLRIFVDGADDVADDGIDARPRAIDDPNGRTTGRAATTVDDPATSPYPIWRETKVYDQGDKIVWHGAVYEAKWFADAGQDPEAPVEHLWDTPWRYLGPVLESDRVVLEQIRVIVDGDFRRWTADAVFDAGERAVYEGGVFRATWWTQGVPPLADPDRPSDHPWEYLGEAELAAGLSEDDLVRRWTADAAFPAGEEVVHRGQRFVARWWNDGVEPDSTPAQPFDHPWEYLGEAD